MMHCSYEYLPLRGLLIIVGLAVSCLTIPDSMADDDILKPEEAYKYDVSNIGDEITVRWRIEPEHYLYKKRMGYASLTEAVKLGEAALPTGISHFDEFFGEMEIYRDEAIVRIPITQRAPGANKVDLELRSQGCADIGLCYPPQVWTTTVTLDTPAVGKLERLLHSGPGSRFATDPLPAELAFQPLVAVIAPFDLQVNWTIAEGYYLYRDSVKVSATGKIAQPGRCHAPARRQASCP